MDIHLITRHLDRRPSLLEHAQRRAAFALSRFGDLVREVELRVCDVNGPRGGPGIACLARLRLVRGGDIVAESAACSPEAGIAQSLERLAGRLRRQLARRQDHR